MFDFANILFSGRCNARCPFCIGRQVDPRLNEDNLDEFPPRELDRLLVDVFVEAYEVPPAANYGRLK